MTIKFVIKSAVSEFANDKENNEWHCNFKPFDS